MVKKLLFILLFVFSVSINAQTNTVNIDWNYGSNSNATGDANASRIIEVGDTVTWTWTSGGHNVVSTASTAGESFNSGAYAGTPSGTTFSHTFTSIGATDYVCSPHAGNMFGTITVVADGSLSVVSFETLGTIDMYPNPTEAVLTIAFEIQNTEKLNIKVYNLLGKQVLAKQISKEDTSLVVSSLNNGIYVVRITSLNGKNATTKRFVKI